jgi:hypothetical protein
MRIILLVVLGVGCGSVKGDEPIDAPAGDGPRIDAAIDAGLCTTMDTIASCGATCTQCMVATDREMATCNGTSCGTVCKAAAPTCSNNGGCSRLTWNFDTGVLEGLAAIQPAGQVLAIRAFQGSNAVAIDITALQTTQIELQIPVCLAGNVSLTPRTLSARYYLMGGTDPGNQYYFQAFVGAPPTSLIRNDSVASGIYNTFSSPLNVTSASATTTFITFRIGSYGANFSGTVYLDNITIQ